MSLLAWSDMFSVGIQEIDSQHKKLLDIANRLNDAMRSAQDRVVLAKILRDLLSYTESHFSFEERLMEKHAYVQTDQHKQEHHKLMQVVVDLQVRFDEGNADLTGEMMLLLRDWLSRHIMSSDKALGKVLNTRGMH